MSVLSTFAVCYGPKQNKKTNFTQSVHLFLYLLLLYSKCFCFKFTPIDPFYVHCVTKIIRIQSVDVHSHALGTQTVVSPGLTCTESVLLFLPN